jgi:chromosome condensin MukBEF ATPase and DNA-binding subunit MukB
LSQNKPAINNQPTVIFSQNKSAPAISHQPNEQTEKEALLQQAATRKKATEEHERLMKVREEREQLQKEIKALKAAIPPEHLHGNDERGQGEEQNHGANMDTTSPLSFTLYSLTHGRSTTNPGCRVVMEKPICKNSLPDSRQQSIRFGRR